MVFLETGTSELREKIAGLLREAHPDFPVNTADDCDDPEYDRMLVERGAVNEKVLLAAYSGASGVPCLDEDEFSEPEPCAELKREYLKTHSVLPYRESPDGITLLVSNPYNMAWHRYAVETFTRRKVEFILAKQSLIERMVERIYFERGDKSAAAVSGDENLLRQLAGEARIVRLVNDMMLQAVEDSASDIHIEPEETRLSIRFRVDGMLKEYIALPLSDYPAVASRVKLIGNLNIAESRLPQDGRTNLKLGAREIDIRISTIPVMRGESIVLRLLRKDAMRFDLRELGMTSEMQSAFSKLIAVPHGILLVVGPTGSGKTTTLYSVMQTLNDHKRKIITIEDPVEYQLDGLSQMQVNPKIGLSFSSGLRHIVRQDPDVILVGEIRDYETADIAINAALTGHLVLSTLHTNDAVGAITRLLDMGVEQFLAASAIFGVLSQRLVRKTCNACKGRSSTGKVKCRVCGGSGYHGRTGIYELLTVTPALREAITAKSSSSALDSLARSEGMIPLLEDGRRKVAEGVTDEAELIRVASDGEIQR